MDGVGTRLGETKKVKQAGQTAPALLRYRISSALNSCAHPGCLDPVGGRLSSLVSGRQGRGRRRLAA